MFYRWMSWRELVSLLKGKKVYNNTDHSKIMNSDAVGFCFAGSMLDAFQLPDEIRLGRWLVEFNVDTSEIPFSKAIGNYENYFYGFTISLNEYCTKEYSLRDMPILRCIHASEIDEDSCLLDLESSSAWINIQQIIELIDSLKSVGNFLKFEKGIIFKHGKIEWEYFNSSFYSYSIDGQKVSININGDINIDTN